MTGLQKVHSKGTLNCLEDHKLLQYEPEVQTDVWLECVPGRVIGAAFRCPAGARDAGMEDTFKAFGERDFDVKAWVNAQVRASEALAAAADNAKGTSVDDHLATLVVKLQLLTQSSSKSIDEHSTVSRPQLSACAPALCAPSRPPPLRGARRPRCPCDAESSPGCVQQTHSSGIMRDDAGAPHV